MCSSDLVLAAPLGLPASTPKATNRWIASQSAKTEIPVMNHTYSSKYYVGFVDVCVSISMRCWCLWGEKPITKQVDQYIPCTNECVLCEKDAKRSMGIHSISGVPVPCKNKCEGCTDHRYGWGGYLPAELGPSGLLEHKAQKPQNVVVGTLYSYSIQETKSDIIVEVKVTKCDPADIVKQLKLYQQYMPDRCMVVATCYPVSQSTKDMFAREGIKHIFLGAGFEAYCAARQIGRAHV